MSHIVFSYVKRNKKFEEEEEVFCHERWEQIAHGRSFVKSDEIDSLMVALL